MATQAGEALEASRLLVKAQAYGLCARFFVPNADRSGTVSSEVLEPLGAALERLGYHEAMVHLQQATAATTGTGPLLDEELVRLFVKGEVPPYETSFETQAARPGAGGPVQQMADIAGFYLAFGFQARGDRPDHLVAELEFLALVCVKEAHARISSEAESAAVCLDARRAFLSQHVLSWLSAFCDRVGQIGRDPRVWHLARAARSLADADHAEITPTASPEFA